MHAPRITICTHLKLRQNLVQQLKGNISVINTKKENKERKKERKKYVDPKGHHKKSTSDTVSKHALCSLKGREKCHQI
jgi:hypothetical protein